MSLDKIINHPKARIFRITDIKTIEGIAFLVKAGITVPVTWQLQTLYPGDSMLTIDYTESNVREDIRRGHSVKCDTDTLIRGLFGQYLMLDLREFFESKEKEQSRWNNG